jgi:hypothetical protein
MTDLPVGEITFPIIGGIFGVGRLATMLEGLADSGQIGPWHVGHWIDFRHTEIRIQFGTDADRKLAESFVENSCKAQGPAGGEPFATGVNGAMP